MPMEDVVFIESHHILSSNISDDQKEEYGVVPLPSSFLAQALVENAVPNQTSHHDVEIVDYQQSSPNY